MLSTDVTEVASPLKTNLVSVDKGLDVVDGDSLVLGLKLGHILLQLNDSH